VDIEQDISEIELNNQEPNGREIDTPLPSETKLTAHSCKAQSEYGWAETVWLANESSSLHLILAAATGLLVF